MDALTGMACAKCISRWALMLQLCPGVCQTLLSPYILLDLPEESNLAQAQKGCWWDFLEGLSLYTARIALSRASLSLKPQLQESSLIREILFTLPLLFTLELCQLPNKKNLCFMEVVRRFALRSSRGYCRQVNKSKELVSPGRVSDGQFLMVLRPRY